MADRFDTFISFAPGDRRWADRLERDLADVGIHAYAPREQGDARSAEAARAIDDSVHAVVLWSEHARRFEQVLLEIKRVASLRASNGHWPRITLLQLDEAPYFEAEPDSIVERTNAYPGDPSQVDGEVWANILRHIEREVRGSRQFRASAARPPEPTSDSEAQTPPPTTDSVRQKSAGSEDPDQLAEDYAVVIGVAKHPLLGDLPQAAHEANAFAEWLQSPSGGRLPPERVTVAVIDALPTSSSVSGFTRAFFSLTKQAIDSGGQRIGRRLYVFVAGFGQAAGFDRLHLFVPDGSREGFEVVDVKQQADWFSQGLFDEVVLFVDCRATSMSLLERLPSPRGLISPPGQGLRTPSFFYVFAKQGLRYEPPDLASAALGPFARTVLEGLQGAAVDPDGEVTSDSLAAYLSRELQRESDGAQEPKILRGGASIHFAGSASPARERAMPAASHGRPDAERVAAHADNPALVDELGRRPFAEVIAQRIDEVRRSTRAGDVHEAGAFVINLHGPWGSGKTSVLNFLKENLQDEKRAADARWVVVEFNAWRHQRLQAPWWTLIKQIHAQAIGQLGMTTSELLRARWFWWRLRADWLPAIVTVLLVAIALVATTLTLVRQGAPAAGDTGIGKAMELGLGVIAALLATSGALIAFSRSLLFGSATAAQAYMDARSDPLGPIITLFEKLVAAIERPLVVFIDDLDRCDSAYVVSLLEGIQTLFRTRQVTYVIAADRKWICSCFEKRYSNFSKTISEPGRPLGYLFLDKVFQVSASVPRVSADVQRSYWQSLLRAGSAAQPRPTEIDRIQREEQRKAEVAARDVRTVQEGDRKIAEAKIQGPIAEQAMRAAVAKQITSPEAMQETEHRLQPFARLLESNPRAMKRLVNAYGLYQAAHILERRDVSPEALARWTIVELRWPLLAERLAQRPGILSVPISESELSKPLRSLLEDREVQAVLSGSPPHGDVLDELSLRHIVGNTEDTERGQLGTRQANPALANATLAT